MRKRIMEVGSDASHNESNERWLNLGEIATVEVTSEEDGFPIESVFASAGGTGWRAGRPGKQLIRIVFDQPVSIDRIQLRFDEPLVERTQEFTLNWCPATGGTTEIVTQQWNFSPAGSITEIEDYAVSLRCVSALELAIQPDISHDGVATLAMWRLAGFSR
jgi:hypothetical protein